MSDVNQVNFGGRRQNAVVLGEKTYQTIDLNIFIYEENRLWTFRHMDSRLPISCIKAARYGFICIERGLIECCYCAIIFSCIGQDEVYTDEQILQLHRENCPVLTQQNFDNIELRNRDLSDSNADLALQYIEYRATLIPPDEELIGIRSLSLSMLRSFLDYGFPAQDIKEVVLQHFFKNGLFPTAEMLSEKL